MQPDSSPLNGIKRFFDILFFDVIFTGAMSGTMLFVNAFRRFFGIDHGRMTQHFRNLDDTLCVWLSMYISLLAVASLALKFYFMRQAELLIPQLLPGYQSGDIVPNIGIITLMSFILAAMGCLCIAWVYGRTWPRLRIAPPAYLMGLVTLAGIVRMRTHPSTAILFLAAFLILLPCFTGSKAEGENRKNNLRARLAAAYRLSLPRLLVNFLLTLPILYAVAMTGISWNPIELPNDYYELSDNVKTSMLFASPLPEDAPATIGRAMALACIEQEKAPLPKGHPRCPIAPGYRINPDADTELHITGDWQSAPGRVFYHHSYIYVPARHIAHYGITGDVPALYGFGHTLVYAAMMKFFGDGLLDYFHYYFIFIFVGAFLIGFAIYKVTGNYVAMLSGLALSLGFFYSVSFVATFLSAGFTPMRYLGLLLQLLSILWVMRRKDGLGIAGLWAALIASFVWNTEFSVMGLMGQALVLFSPALPLNFFRRAASLLLLMATLGLMFTFKNSGADMLLYSNPLGFFKVGVAPSVPSDIFACLVLSILLAAILLAYSASRFPPAAAHARYAILPVLATLPIKYLYTPSPVHFYTVLTLSVPLTLIYYPYWNKFTAGKLALGQLFHAPFKALIYAASVLFCLIQLNSYYKEATEFRHHMFDSLAVAPWAQLHEKLPTAVPVAPIARRVEAIRSVMQPDDTFLFLSPLDHLLSFLIEPRHFCGHFELVSNLVTKENMAQMERCALEKPGILVVYDKTLPTACPEGFAKGYSNAPDCLYKWKLKQAEITIHNDLRDRLVPVKETEDLILYRIKPAP